MTSWLLVLWQSFQSPLDPDNVRIAVQAIAFVTSFLIYILTIVVARKVYIRLQRQAFFISLILIASLILSILELVTSVTVFGISNPFLKSGLAVWGVGLVMLVLLMGDILSTDRATFKKPCVSKPFENFQDVNSNQVSDFGLSCVDSHFKDATSRKRRIFFPILLIADKSFSPWRFAARFAVAGLKDPNDGGGLVYFALNQPADVVIDQLAQRFVNIAHPEETNEGSYWNPAKGGTAPRNLESVVVIDCHSKWLEKAGTPTHKCEYELAHRQVQVLRSDPRDPFELSRKYERAIQTLMGKGVRRIRVVYDSISDFLIYSDPQLAVQFIKHNMVWENQVGVSSLYLYTPGVPHSSDENVVDESFLRWNSNCVIEFKRVGKDDTMILEGLFEDRISEVVQSEPHADYRSKA